MSKTQANKPNNNGKGDTNAQAALDAARLETERKRMLVQLSGQLAASVLLSPSDKTTSAEAIAEISVDVAEQILQRIGF